LAAKKLGIAEVPVMVAAGWTEAQKRAYVLADNKLALNAGWDNDLLKVEFAELQGFNFDLGLTGFSLDEIGALTADKTAGLTDPDETPEPPADPVTEPGDVWVLGNHRLICGDSTSADVVAKLLGPVKPHLMVTDPPYGVEYDANWRDERARTSAGMNRAPGAGAVGKVLNDDRADWRDAWALFPGDVVYCWHADLRAITISSTSLAGMRCDKAARGTGPATANRRRSGRSTSRKNRRPGTARKSRSSA
jgi:hypothetical protein